MSEKKIEMTFGRAASICESVHGLRRYKMSEILMAFAIIYGDTLKEMLSSLKVESKPKNPQTGDLKPSEDRLFDAVNKSTKR